MNLVKSVSGKTLMDIETEINDFLKSYKGELIHFQILKNEEYNQYEALFSYKQSAPTKK